MNDPLQQQYQDQTQPQQTRKPSQVEEVFSQLIQVTHESFKAIKLIRILPTRIMKLPQKKIETQIGYLSKQVYVQSNENYEGIMVDKSNKNERLYSCIIELHEKK